MKFRKMFTWFVAANLIASVMGASALAEGQTGQSSNVDCSGVTANAGTGASAPAVTTSPQPSSAPSGTAINGSR